MKKNNRLADYRRFRSGKPAANETSTSSTPKGWESTDLEMSTPDLKKLYQEIFKYPKPFLGDDPTPYEVVKYLTQMIGLVCQNAGADLTCVLSVAVTAKSGDLAAVLEAQGKIINQAVLVSVMQEHLERSVEQYDVE